MMTFSLFMIFMAFLVAAISFFHYTQGLFTGVISAVVAGFAAVIAISYHESVVERFNLGSMSDSANGVVVIVLFAVVYLVLREVFDRVVPGGVSLPAMADKIGGAIAGLVAGVFAAGVVAFAAQNMSFHPTILGYSRMEVEEASAGIRTGGAQGKTKTYPLYDAMMNDKPLHTTDSTAQQKMYLPVDDVVVGTAMMLSDRGALSTDKPVAKIHPDWLQELFGQRVGVQAAAKRVMVNPPDGGSGDVTVTPDEAHLGAGLYYLDDKTSLYQQAGEIEGVTKLRPAGPDDRFGSKKLGKGEIGVVVRVYFGKKAKDNKDSLIRLSMGTVRICTQKPDGQGGTAWTNYYPLGTLEPSTEPNPRPDERFSVYLQRPDDYLFLDDDTSGETKVGWDTFAEAKLAGVDKRKSASPTADPYVEVVGDKGVDLVFRVEAEGFLANKADPKSEITPGTFLEVKRLARVDLAGTKMKPLLALPQAGLPRTAATRVFRKEILKNQLTTVATLTRALVGEWEGVFHNPQGEEVNSRLTARPDGTLTFAITPPAGVQASFGPQSTTGTWKIDRVAGDDAVTAKFTFAKSLVLPTTDSMTLTFNDTLSGMKYASTSPQVPQISFSRIERATPSAGTPPAAAPAPAPPAGAPSPATPAAPPAAPGDASPPPAAAKLDPTLRASDPADNNKFREQIGAASGEAQVAGGTVTIEGGKIKALALPLATRAQLRGTAPGEPVIRLAAPDGTRTVQFECQPAAAGGWEWLAAVGSMELTDTAGGKHKLAGAWAVMGDDSVTGRYSADAPVNFAGFTPAAGKPSLVVLAFNVPEAAEPKELTTADGRVWAKK